jgi:predicted phage-related endonuclease
MGLSSFKTRWTLLQEKAGLIEVAFHGNKYTVYGQKMEPQIRDYLNQNRVKKFEPNRVINGDIRCHTDG